jgi:hypothetical protein
MNGMCVVDDICENCRIAANGNELFWCQGWVEEDGGKFWGRGEWTQKES